jgi:ribosome modulation factor
MQVGTVPNAIAVRRQFPDGRSKRHGGCAGDDQYAFTGSPAAGRRLVEDNTRPIRQADNDLMSQHYGKWPRIRSFRDDAGCDGTHGKNRTVCSFVTRNGRNQWAGQFRGQAGPHHAFSPL